MTPTSSSFPAPPEEPEEYLCCHRHCSPCIRDYYREALARWADEVRRQGGDPDSLLKAKGQVAGG